MDTNTTKTKICPSCSTPAWDASTADQRLNKCHKCGLRFDNAPGQTLGDKMIELSYTRDPKRAGKIADFLRFQRGANYNKVAAFFAGYGFTTDDFEELMAAADSQESRA